MTVCSGLNVLSTSTKAARVVYMYSLYFGFAKNVMVPGRPSSILLGPLMVTSGSPVMIPSSKAAICLADTCIGQS